MKKYITPCNYDISLEDIKANLKPEPTYADIPIQDLKKLSIVHSDLTFINSEGKLSLVEDNIKPDYNEWNW